MIECVKAGTSVGLLMRVTELCAPGCVEWDCDHTLVPLGVREGSGLKSRGHLRIGDTMELESKARQSLTWQEQRERNYCRISQGKE